MTIQPSYNTLNGTAVDGFTIPYKVHIIKDGPDEAPSCVDINASQLNVSNCPADDDISTTSKRFNTIQNYIDSNNQKLNNPLFNFSTSFDNTNTITPGNEKITKANLQMKSHRDSSKIIGCFSPYQKLLAPVSWGGFYLGHDVNQSTAYDSNLIMYTNPYNMKSLEFNSSSDGVNSITGNATQLQVLRDLQIVLNKNYDSKTRPQDLPSQVGHNGPIVKTKYFNYIRGNSNIYSWQDDDKNGTRSCTKPRTQFVWILCPQI
jgi:hypothetical protein